MLLLAPALGVAAPSATECIQASEVGQEKRKAGQLVEARRLFASCSVEACAAEIRSDCGLWFREVEATLPTVVLVARDAAGADLVSVRVEVDGVELTRQLDGRPLAIDPGTHTFRFVSGTRSAERKVLVAAGQKNRSIVVSFPAPAPAARPVASSSGQPSLDSPSSAASPVPWLIAGAGVVAIGAGAWVGLKAKSDLDSLESAPCAKTRTCSEAEVDSVQRRFWIADLAMGVGVISLGVGTWWLLSKPEPRAGSARLELGPRSARVVAEF
jgi:hypothetical protein